MVEDPRVNFALSQRADAPGVNHLGFQTESGEELHDKHARLQAADAALLEQTGQACCYARSDKNWGHRSGGRCVGDFSHPREHSGVWRSHAFRAR
jgi:hypothetical protein